MILLTQQKFECQRTVRITSTYRKESKMTTILSSVPSFSSFGVRQPSSASRSADVAGLSRVKRCLFGPRSAEDARQTALQVAAELQEQIEAASLRWNFDFGRDRPLDGRFHWSSSLLTSKSTLPSPAESTPSAASPAKRPVDQSKLRQSQITGKLTLNCR